MRILLLDAKMAVKEAVEARFASTHSLYDYDMVLWDPLRSLQTYNGAGYGSGNYKGVRRLSDHESATIQRDLERRRPEIAEYLRMGRTLVVFLAGDLGVWVDTGERRVSGTGRNAKSTTIVDLFDIMRALPFHLDPEFVSGSEMEPVTALSDRSIGRRKTGGCTRAPLRPTLRRSCVRF
jgi:hypothetical protein